jgi:hypothetical protein
MQTIGRRAYLLLILLSLAGLTRAELTASVDRTELAMNESFTLTISLDGISVLTRPDLTPLETDFHVLGSSRNHRSSLVNGDLVNSTTWVVQLMPKTSGATSIPPLTVGDEQTPIIEINVRRQSGDSGAAGDENVVLEAELSDNIVYVTGQVMLTLRVSMTQSARFRLEEPEIDQAIVRELGESNFQQVRDGRRYDVTEYRYAIFPNIPGELVIDPLSLVAEVLSSRPRSMFDPMFGRSKRVLRRTEPLTINVLDIPEGIAPSDWLPASSLSLTEEWSQDIQQLEVGDSITRTITLQALGVTAAQLPPLLQPNIDGLKLYADQPAATDNVTTAGIRGERVERIAVVATRPGTFSLPEQRVPWWDVTSNSARVAVLPAVTFEVAPGAQASADITAPVTRPAISDPAVAPGPAPISPAWYLYRQWWWITALLLLACLAALVQYLRTRRQLQELAKAHDPAPVTVAVDSETRAWQRLRSACENGDAQSIHPALQDWCQHYWQLSQRPGIAELKATGADQALIVEAQNLEQHLYGKGQREKWNPQALAEAVRQQRAGKHQSGRNAQDSHLPPLYQ